jgi:hypothetical protein
VPANTFTNTVWVSIEEKPATAVTGFGNAERFFSLRAIYTDTYHIAELQPGQTLALSVQYDPSLVRAETVGLYWFDGAGWSQRGISSTVQVDVNQVIAHLTIPVRNRTEREQQQADSLLNGDTIFALLYEPRRLFLPLINQ